MFLIKRRNTMSLNIIVCIKSVVRSAPRGIARRTPENSEFNPFDRPALEAALQLKSAYNATVTALTMGPATSSAVLAEARAMGVDRAVLISDRALAESDTLVTSRVLAAAIRRLASFDLILFGVRTSDSDTGQVGPQTAAVLDIPFISGIRKITLSEDAQKTGNASPLEIQRVMDDWQERWRLALPAAMTIDPRAYAARPVSLSGLSDAYVQPAVETLSLADLEMSENEVGLAGSPTRVAGLQKIKRKRSCDFLGGEPREQIETLMERLSKSGVMES
jgi:electron transfer flavoprotein beta subunit